MVHGMLGHYAMHGIQGGLHRYTFLLCMLLILGHAEG
jgi:hypothetical protein